jgi:hypothetical protein
VVVVSILLLEGAMKNDEFGLSEGYGDVVEESMEGPGVWLHVPGRGVLTAVLLREKPVRYEAHWVGGRVRPCPGRERCQFHKDGLGSKVRYVYTLFDTHRRQAGLLEVSPQTAGDIMRECADHGFARGLSFSFKKEGGRENGRIVAKCLHAIMRELELPEGPDAAFVLRKQWQLPECETVRPSVRSDVALWPAE